MSGAAAGAGRGRDGRAGRRERQPRCGRGHHVAAAAEASAAADAVGAGGDVKTVVAATKAIANALDEAVPHNMRSACPLTQYALQLLYAVAPSLPPYPGDPQPKPVRFDALQFTLELIRAATLSAARYAAPSAPPAAVDVKTTTPPPPPPPAPAVTPAATLAAAGAVAAASPAVVVTELAHRDVDAQRRAVQAGVGAGIALEDGDLCDGGKECAPPSVSTATRAWDADKTSATLHGLLTRAAGPRKPGQQQLLVMPTGLERLRPAAAQLNVVALRRVLRADTPAVHRLCALMGGTGGGGGVRSVVLRYPPRTEAGDATLHDSSSLTPWAELLCGFGAGAGAGAGAAAGSSTVSFPLHQRPDDDDSGYPTLNSVSPLSVDRVLGSHVAYARALGFDDAVSEPSSSDGAACGALPVFSAAECPPLFRALNCVIADWTDDDAQDAYGNDLHPPHRPLVTDTLAWLHELAAYDNLTCMAGSALHALKHGMERDDDLERRLHAWRFVNFGHATRRRAALHTLRRLERVRGSLGLVRDFSAIQMPWLVNLREWSTYAVEPTCALSARHLLSARDFRHVLCHAPNLRALTVSLDCIDPEDWRTAERSVDGDDDGDGSEGEHDDDGADDVYPVVHVLQAIRAHGRGLQELSLHASATCMHYCERKEISRELTMLLGGDVTQRTVAPPQPQPQQSDAKLSADERADIAAAERLEPQRLPDTALTQLRKFHFRWLWDILPNQNGDDRPGVCSESFWYALTRHPHITDLAISAWDLHAANEAYTVALLRAGILTRLQAFTLYGLSDLFPRGRSAAAWTLWDPAPQPTEGLWAAAAALPQQQHLLHLAVQETLLDATGLQTLTAALGPKGLRELLSLRVESYGDERNDDPGGDAGAQGLADETRATVALLDAVRAHPTLQVFAFCHKLATPIDPAPEDVKVDALLRARADELGAALALVLRSDTTQLHTIEFSPLKNVSGALAVLDALTVNATVTSLTLYGPSRYYRLGRFHEINSALAAALCANTALQSLTWLSARDPECASTVNGARATRHYTTDAPKYRTEGGQVNDTVPGYEAVVRRRDHMIADVYDALTERDFKPQGDVFRALTLAVRANPCAALTSLVTDALCPSSSPGALPYGDKPLTAMLKRNQFAAPRLHHNWWRVCVCLVFVRANALHPLRHSILSILRNERATFSALMAADVFSAEAVRDAIEANPRRPEWVYRIA